MPLLSNRLYAHNTGSVDWRRHPESSLTERERHRHLLFQRWKEGDMISSEQALLAKCGVSRLSARSSLLVRERGNGSELLKVSQFALVFFQSTRDGLSELDAALARGDLALMRELGHGSRRRPRSSVRAAWRSCARTWKICQNPTSKRT